MLIYRQVSKDLFAYAVKAYIKAQTIQEHNTYNHIRVVGKNLCDMPLFKPYATSVRTSKRCDDIQALEHFQRIKRVEVVVYLSDLYEDQVMLHKLFTEAEISKLLIAKRLARIRGIATICCLPVGTLHRAEDGMGYLANLTTLQKYLSSIVRQSRRIKPDEQAAKTTGPPPLYLGSRVSGVGCASKLLTKLRRKQALNSLA